MSCFISDSLTVQERPTFIHLEVADDLSFLVCTDSESNMYLVNFDQYFEDFSSQLVVSACSQGRCSSVGSVKFQYEADDEDAVVRVVQLSGVTYGDRVWKTELQAFRRDASRRACLSSVSGYNRI